MEQNIYAFAKFFLRLFYYWTDVNVSHWDSIYQCKSRISVFPLSKMEYLLHFLKLKSVRDISIPPNYIAFQIPTRTGTIRSLNRPKNAQYIRSLPTVSWTIGRHYYLYKFFLRLPTAGRSSGQTSHAWSSSGFRWAAATVLPDSPGSSRTSSWNQYGSMRWSLQPSADIFHRMGSAAVSVRWTQASVQHTQTWSVSAVPVLLSLQDGSISSLQRQLCR